MKEAITGSFTVSRFLLQIWADRTKQQNVTEIVVFNLDSNGLPHAIILLASARSAPSRVNASEGMPPGNPLG